MSEQTGTQSSTANTDTAKTGTGNVGRHALIFIFITILIDVIGIGIIIPVAPGLIAELAHTNLSSAARFGGWLMFVYAGMQFLFAPLIGNLSDRFGRRPLLIYSLISMGIDYLIVALAPSLMWMFVGRILSGIAGASFTIANAYIADITPPEKRASNFGMLGAAFGIGFIIGPALGGVLGDIWVRLPFYVSAGLAFCNALYGYFVLKESHPPRSRRRFEWQRANPLGAVLMLKRFPLVLGLTGILILMRFAHDASPSVWTYYTMLKFHWAMKDVGLSLMAMGLVTALAYGGLTRLIIPRLGERRSVYLGLLATAAGFAGFAFASAGWMLFAFMPLFALSSLVMPSLNAMMTRTVGPAHQGELQGALTSMGSLTSVLAPLFMTNLFAYFTGAHAPVWFPGAAFLAAAFVTLAAAFLFAFVGPRGGNRASPEGTKQ